jgi:hypothetical protein
MAHAEILFWQFDCVGRCPQKVTPEVVVTDIGLS